MLPPKELQGRFKAAAWQRREDLEAFVAEAEGTPGRELLKLVEIAATRSLVIADAAAHRARCGVLARVLEKSGDKSLFLPLARSLRAADPVLRAALTAVLPRINSVADHAELCALLRVPDPSVRQALAKVISQVGSNTLFSSLSQVVREGDHPGRVEATEALVAFAHHLAIPVLEPLVRTGSAADKALALKHLGDARMMGKDAAGALRAIAPALDDGSEAVAAQAVSAFCALCSEDDWFEHVAPRVELRTVAVQKAAVDALRRFDSPRVIGALQRRMRAGPRQIRLTVLSVLEAIATDAVLPPLVEGLAHKQLPVRTRATEVLSGLSLSGKLDVARTVLWLLRSRDVNVRRMASEVLRTVKDPDESLWPRLISLLRDEDWWVRERVMDALIERGGVPLARHLVPYLADRSDVVRRFACRMLGRLKDSQALRALVAAAGQDADWWVRESAVEAIAAINDPRAMPYLVRLMHADIDLQLVCLQALVDMKARPAAPAVAKLLAGESPDVRIAAVQALRALSNGEQAALVAPLQEDPVAAVRRAAREALAEWDHRVDAVAAQTGLRLDQLLARLSRDEGDDLLLAPGRAVFAKVRGKVVPVTQRPLTAEHVQALLAPLLTPEHQESLALLRDVDFPYEVKADGLRFRAHVFQEAGGLGAVFRRIRGTLIDFDSLGLPEVARGFGDLKNGLVLVGGPTGSGKSTTLAALIDLINRTSARHIISLEDPIEVLHPHKKSLVNQREVGTHTTSFATALRSTLRQDPNVILVGELRDLDTIAFTVTAAETGHLVFGTVHTVSAATTVDRLVSAFPPAKQDTVRAMLAESLRAVVCQHLIPRKDGEGRCLAAEVMLNTDAVANVIRKGKSFQLPSIIATARELGMQLMDSDLMRLLKAGRISADEAYVKSTNKKDFEALLEGASAPAIPPARAVS